MIGDVSLKTLEDYLVDFPKKKFEKGELLLDTDKKVGSIYLLLSGFVRHYTISAEAEEFTHNILKPHSLFPFHLALNQLPNPHYFEAITPVEVQMAPVEEVVSHLMKTPELSLALSKKLASGLNQLSFRSESLLFGTAQQKLAATLYLLGKRFGQVSSAKKSKSSSTSSSSLREDKIEINSFPITHQLLATMTGLTRETVSLEMMNLKKQKMIDYRRQNISILNLEDLKEISSLPFYY